MILFFPSDRTNERGRGRGITKEEKKGGHMVEIQKEGWRRERK